jgi:hypothetical protein
MSIVLSNVNATTGKLQGREFCTGWVGAFFVTPALAKACPDCFYAHKKKQICVHDHAIRVYRDWTLGRNLWRLTGGHFEQLIMH